MRDHLLPIGLCLLALLGCVTTEAEEPNTEPRQRSVTIFPVVITPSKNIGAELQVRGAEVLGLFLERAGMTQIEISQRVFSPPDTDDMAKIATAFGQFVAGQPPKTDFAIFCQIVGTPQTGPQEIRAVVVDRTGQLVLTDQAGQDEFSRSRIKPDCPMTCILFLANQLRPVWALADPLREDAPEGKMAEVMRRRSGLPAAEEYAAMDRRLQALADNIATAEVTVYPIHLWPGSDERGAIQLAEMLNEQHICRAVASKTDPKLTIRGDPNEQKILWDTARAFQEFLRNNPPATQYALLADYGLSPSSDGKKGANHVHLILCERTGEWVLVDFQNSHHADFQSIDPKSIDDCNRLAIRRATQLKSRLAE